jgi:hypothetical protein
MAKKASVEIQKGAIELNKPHTMQMMTSVEKVTEDSRYMMERRDGQLLKFHTPKR